MLLIKRESAKVSKMREKMKIRETNMSQTERKKCKREDNGSKISEREIDRKKNIPNKSEIRNTERIERERE